MFCRLVWWILYRLGFYITTQGLEASLQYIFDYFFLKIRHFILSINCLSPTIGDFHNSNSPLSYFPFSFHEIYIHANIYWKFILHFCLKECFRWYFFTKSLFAFSIWRQCYVARSLINLKRIRSLSLSKMSIICHRSLERAHLTFFQWKVNVWKLYIKTVWLSS